MKKVLALILTLAMALSLVACGGAKEEPAPAPAPAPDAPATSEPAPAPSADPAPDGTGEETRLRPGLRHLRKSGYLPPEKAGKSANCTKRCNKFRRRRGLLSCKKSCIMYIVPRYARLQFAGGKLLHFNSCPDLTKGGKNNRLTCGAAVWRPVVTPDGRMRRGQGDMRRRPGHQSRICYGNYESEERHEDLSSAQGSEGQEA